MIHPKLQCARNASLADSTDDTIMRWNWCDKTPSSSRLTVEYGDYELNQPRLFVSGIRLCMNRNSRRLKGYQIRGKRISDTGSVQEIPVGSYSKSAGNTAFNKNSAVGTPGSPASIRSNCSNADWMKWVNCSRPDQVATGLVVHIGAGKELRAITGLALRCQIVQASRL